MILHASTLSDLATARLAAIGQERHTDRHEALLTLLAREPLISS